MRNYLDQIDDYLTGRLSDSNKALFEAQMNSDSALKNEVAMRRLIVKNIQSARIRELKTMLNGVPVGGVGFFSKLLTPMKVFLAVATITASLSTWYYARNRSTNKPQIPLPEEVEKPIIQSKKDSLQEPTIKEKSVKATEKKKPEKVKAPAAVAAPTVPMPDVSEENTATKETKDIIAKKDPTANPPIDGHNFLLEVKIYPEINNHPLSYKFEYNTLMLYGKQGKKPYKILDFSHTKHDLYIFFANKYYELDTHQAGLKKLEPLTNIELINQLKKLKDK